MLVSSLGECIVCRISSLLLCSHISGRGEVVRVGLVAVEPAVHRRYCPAEELKVWNRKEKYKLVKTQVLVTP